MLCSQVRLIRDMAARGHTRLARIHLALVSNFQKTASGMRCLQIMYIYREADDGMILNLNQATSGCIRLLYVDPQRHTNGRNCRTRIRLWPHLPAVSAGPASSIFCAPSIWRCGSALLPLMDARHPATHRPPPIPTATDDSQTRTSSADTGHPRLHINQDTSASPPSSFSSRLRHKNKKCRALISTQA